MRLRTSRNSVNDCKESCRFISLEGAVKYALLSPIISPFGLVLTLAREGIHDDNPKTIKELKNISSSWPVTFLHKWRTVALQILGWPVCRRDPAQKSSKDGITSDDADGQVRIGLIDNIPSGSVSLFHW